MTGTLLWAMQGIGTHCGAPADVGASPRQRRWAPRPGESATKTRFREVFVETPLLSHRSELFSLPLYLVISQYFRHHKVEIFLHHSYLTQDIEFKIINIHSMFL